MARASLEPKEPIECGFCMEQNDQLIDPRSLPCKHTHCYPCLVRDFETRRIVKCGTCREVFDVTLARLPGTAGQKERVCDSCVEKEVNEEVAVSYCSSCNRKMCRKHLEFHEEFFPLHRDVPKIEEYRSCSRHEDLPITTGCSTCCRALCTTCIVDKNGCDNDTAHSQVSLEELVKLLKVKRDKAKAEAQIREGELSALLKYSTKVHSDYEKKTEELIKQLHSTRDKQLAELRNKYDDLEKDLLENRRRSKEQLVKFMEREVGVRMTEINTLLLMQNTRFKDAQPVKFFFEPFNQIAVDLAERYATTANDIQRFIDEDLPSFKLTNQKALSTQAEAREIELKMVDAVDIPVCQLFPPTSLMFNNVVDNVVECHSVCHSDGVTYVGGKEKNVYKINDYDSSVSSLPSIEGVLAINGLCVYEEKLYILAYPFKVIITDMTATQITSWVHPDKCTYINKLVVTGEKVVVPDRSNKRISVYSLDGQVIKHIPCPQDGELKAMALCAPDQESVVVSSDNTSTVFRVNIETGEVVWTSTAVTKPGGVTCYTKKYILVTPIESDHTEIHILHADTGNHVGKLMDTEKRAVSEVLDLCVKGDTLIVPRKNQNAVLYYKLMSK
ncbi:uncharacterized protein [Watersipora subatra]|uniref:uncharacterized protein n=1 Tax=Watersipora subatra TaxID=2589382 RepID=UPI00355AF843